MHLSGIPNPMINLPLSSLSLLIHPTKPSPFFNYLSLIIHTSQSHPHATKYTYAKTSIVLLYIFSTTLYFSHKLVKETGKQTWKQLRGLIPMYDLFLKRNLSHHPLTGPIHPLPDLQGHS